MNKSQSVGLEAEIKRLRDLKNSRERITFDKLVEAFRQYPYPERAWRILQHEALNADAEIMEKLGAEGVLAGMLLGDLQSGKWPSEDELIDAMRRCTVLGTTFWLWFLTNCDGKQDKFNDRRLGLGDAILALSKVNFNPKEESENEKLQ